MGRRCNGARMRIEREGGGAERWAGNGKERHTHIERERERERQREKERGREGGHAWRCSGREGGGGGGRRRERNVRGVGHIPPHHRAWFQTHNEAHAVSLLASASTTSRAPPRGKPTICVQEVLQPLHFPDTQNGKGEDGVRMPWSINHEDIASRWRPYVAESTIKAPEINSSWPN